MTVYVRNDRVAHWLARRLPRNVLRWAVIHANARCAAANPREHADFTASAMAECLELPPRPSTPDPESPA